jgi:hypothetical protein
MKIRAKTASVDLVIPGGEDCYCGQRDWKQTGGRAGSTVAFCDNCGYVAAISFPGKAREDEQG